MKQTLKFVDLCAGLGGFHHALSLVEGALGEDGRFRFECVLACDIDPGLRELYVQNFPEIRDAYRREFPPEASARSGWGLYGEDGALRRIHGDLGDLVDLENGTVRIGKRRPKGPRLQLVPDHDILFAGFPCQPFSKSGAQRGFADLRGTVFGMIATILKACRPTMAVLENVGNFERHDDGNTWRRVRGTLEYLGYEVWATTHVVSGGEHGGLLSPHHIGEPHHRERFFILALHREGSRKLGLCPSMSPFPPHFRRAADPARALQRVEGLAEARLREIISEAELGSAPGELEACRLPQAHVACIQHWNALLAKLRDAYRLRGTAERDLPMPSFPIWGYELDPWNWYPADENPAKLACQPSLALRGHWARRRREAMALGIPPPGGERAFLGRPRPLKHDLEAWALRWPAYARERDEWPRWKVRFIAQNRQWARVLAELLDPIWLRRWLDRLQEFPPSLQKLEWNCQGEPLDLHLHILQFRPSGLRAKRLRHVPALVAMTPTQVPIVPALTEEGRKRVGPDGLRYLTTREALALQGLPSGWRLPDTREAAARALGNAVHARLVKEILLRWLFRKVAEESVEDAAAVPAEPGPAPRPRRRGRPPRAASA